MQASCGEVPRQCESTYGGNSPARFRSCGMPGRPPRSSRATCHRGCERSFWAPGGLTPRARLQKRWLARPELARRQRRGWPWALQAASLRSRARAGEHALPPQHSRCRQRACGDVVQVSKMFSDSSLRSRSCWLGLHGVKTAGARQVGLSVFILQSVLHLCGPRSRGTVLESREASALPSACRRGRRPGLPCDCANDGLKTVAIAARITLDTTGCIQGADASALIAYALQLATSSNGWAQWRPPWPAWLAEAMEPFMAAVLQGPRRPGCSSLLCPPARRRLVGENTVVQGLNGVVAGGCPPPGP